MSKVEGVRVPIVKAERVLAQRRLYSTGFEQAKAELLKMLNEDLKELGLALNEVSRFSNYVYQRYLASSPNGGCFFYSLEQIVSEEKNIYNLNKIKQGVALYALDNLGALYTKKRGYRSSDYDHERIEYLYDSPTLKSPVSLFEKPSEIPFYKMDYNFDADQVLKDIPLLIQKSKDLAEQLKQEGLDSLVFFGHCPQVWEKYLSGIEPENRDKINLPFLSVPG